MEMGIANFVISQSEFQPVVKSWWYK